MSGLGERAGRLRRLAKGLDPVPAVPPFFVQNPELDPDTRAIGWHMRRERGDSPEYLGHNAISAELYLREELGKVKKAKPKRQKAGAK